MGPAIMLIHMPVSANCLYLRPYGAHSDGTCTRRQELEKEVNSCSLQCDAHLGIRIS